MSNDDCWGSCRGMTHFKLHPRQGLAAKRVKHGRSLGQAESREVDNLQDSSLLALAGALLCSKALASAGSNKAA